jgi:hypothetical protein
MYKIPIDNGDASIAINNSKKVVFKAYDTDAQTNITLVLTPDQASEIGEQLVRHGKRINIESRNKR